MTHQQKQTAIVEKIRNECEWLVGEYKEKDGYDSVIHPKLMVTYFPPTLSDLLYVIKSQYKFESNECAVRWKERNIGVFCGSKFPCVLHNGDTLQILGMYNLALPLITNLEQSEDLTNFIHELICH